MVRAITFDIDENGCFVCTSHKPNKDGYRQLKIEGKTQLMHRVIYTETFGTIPDGYVVRHKCDNPHCINPEHLETGTVADNNRDRDERGRRVIAKGELHGHSKLTATQVYEIYKRVNNGDTLLALAKEYGVEKSTIFKIKHRITWRHLAPMFTVLTDIESERLRQLELWGPQNHNYAVWLGILMEEVGEVAQAVNALTVPAASKETDADDLYNELIQVAAVAAAIAEQVLEEKHLAEERLKEGLHGS